MKKKNYSRGLLSGKNGNRSVSDSSCSKALPERFDAPEIRQVRVFISSTFKDMQAERDLLVKKTFPELRARCRERSVEFMEVDLRWGITEEQSRRGEVLPVCLAEIENCRSYFIGILGECYGWVPERIDRGLLETQPWLAEYGEKSITELEILHGVLNNPEMTEHAFFYFRDPAYLDKVAPDLKEDLVPVSPKDSEKLRNLKDRIRQIGLRISEDYPDPEAFAEQVLEDLWQVIDGKYPLIDEPSQLDRELAEHEAFANSRIGTYVVRQSYFERLDNHVKSDDPPLVLTGDSGCGKSALIANWAAKYRKENPSNFLLLHFVGGTSDSSDVTGILARIMGELKRRFCLPGEIPTDTSAIHREFPNWLSMASVKGRFVLVIDGLNQFDNWDSVRELGWLPEYFPPNARVILSTVFGPTLDALKRREYPMYQISALNKGEREQFIAEYLWKYRKRLNDIQTNRIVKATQSENPLYLRVLLDELKVFGIYEQLDERIDHYLEAQSPADLYERVLERLEEDYEKERPELVRDTLSLIWAARSGLSEREILDLLNVPQAVWSPLYLSLKDSLVARSGLLEFFHDFLRQAVERRYLSSEARRAEAHRHLADYFERSETEERRVEEFPWQLWKCGETNRLERALSDLDLSQAIWARNEEDLLRFWSFLERESNFKKEITYQKAIENPSEHHDHLLWILVLFNKTGLLSTAMKLYKEVERICREMDNKHGLLSSLNEQGLIYRDWRNLEEAMRLHKEAEEISREMDNKHELLGSLNGQALVHQDWRNLEEAMRLHKEAEEISREMDNKHELLGSLNGQALIHKDWGNLEEAMRLHKEGEEISKELGNKQWLSASLENQAGIHRDWGNLEEAMRLLKEGEEISRELGHKGGLSISLGNQGLIQHELGNPEEAMRLNKEAEEIFRELGNNHVLSISLDKQAGIHRDWGNLEEAMRLLKEAEEICRELGNKIRLHVCLNNQAGIHQDWGNLEEAMRLSKEAEEIFREPSTKDGLFHSFASQAAVHSDLGNHVEAMRLYKETEAICRKLGNNHALSISLDNQAVIQQNLGNLEEAMRLHKEAGKIFRKLDNKHSLSSSLINQALIHRDWGNPEKAMELLKDAEHICRELGNKDGLQFSLGTQAEIHRDWDNLEEAMKLYKEMERICREIGNNERLQISLTYQALIYKDWGNPEEAMELLKDAEHICRELGNKDGLQFSLDNQALIHQDWGNFEEAMRLQKEAEGICRELGNKDGLQISLANQALIHQEMGNLEEAMRLHKEIEGICRELGNKDGLQTSIGDQALIHQDWGNHKEAMELYKEAEGICRDLGNKEGLYFSLGNQSVIHEEMGNLDEAMRLVKEAEEVCKEMGGTSELAHIYLNQALLWHEGYHKPEKALPPAEMALKLFREVGMEAKVKEMEDLVEILKKEVQ